MDSTNLHQIMHDTVHIIDTVRTHFIIQDKISLWKEIVGLLKEVTVLFAALFAAKIGINSWKNQLIEKGKFEYKLKILDEKRIASEKILQAVYNLRNCIDLFRAPFQSAEEISNAVREFKERYQKNPADISTLKIDETFAVYQIRWEKVMVANTLFEKELPSIEALFGKSTISIVEGMKSNVRKLYVSMIQFLRMKNNVLNRDYFEKLEKILNKMETDDEFTLNLQKSINAIEDQFRKYLQIEDIDKI